MKPLRIGVDLDNTIICYDALFHSAAVAKGLVPQNCPAKKAAVKNHIQSRHGDPTWTALQAEVYGPLILQAKPYPGALNFFRHCHAEKIETRIISHKSRFPALGVQADLHAAALEWLGANGWFGSETGLTRSAVEFHPSRKSKVEAIVRFGCEIFIDDLPEVFQEPHFPRSTAGMLFDPDQAHIDFNGLPIVRHWSEIENRIFASATIS